MVMNRRQDQEVKSEKVLLTIEAHCDRLADQFACFYRIKDCLEQGDQLVAESLTGGLTNYSFKISLKQSPSVALFAKLAFPYALWSSDKSNHYDVQRTQNEFKMMEMFASICPGCAPVPYLCEPVDDMMVLVTEWNDNDEQLATQVIEGRMDPRVATGLARSIAKLHCQDFDPDFNTDIRTTMVSTFATLQKKLDSMIASSPSTDNSRASLLVRTMGQQECQELVDTMLYHYENSRDCLVHSDLHVMNILVENQQVANGFGQEGSFSVVDWEMAFAGPIGRDLGSFLPFPLCCALAHALKGNQDEQLNLLNAIDTMWDEYADALRREGKSDDFINYALRSSIGWCGRFMFLGFYTSGVHTEDFPLDNDVGKDILMDTIGVLGLKFMKLGFDSKYSNFNLTDLRQTFTDSIWDEIDLITFAKASQPTSVLPSHYKPTADQLDVYPSMFCVRDLFRNGRTFVRIITGSNVLYQAT